MCSEADVGLTVYHRAHLLICYDFVQEALLTQRQFHVIQNLCYVNSPSPLSTCLAGLAAKMEQYSETATDCDTAKVRL